ncbi:glycosyltransferase [Cryptosporangium japonicum]|uniref:Glycosyltransferase n=1 Tax=Cryptosporangium japonicum TaxID=80872 RepID=A0ABN0U717_9ACTN
MAVVLLVTHGSGGDVLPFVRIGAALAARGHDVSLLTHAPYAARVRAAGLEFVPIDTEESYPESQVGIDVRSPDELRRHYRKAGLFAQLDAEVAALAERHRPGATVLVGRHTSALSVLIAAEALGAPAVTVAVAPVQLLVAPAAALNLARGLADGVGAVRARHGLPARTDWLRWLGSSARTLGLWPRWFDAAGAPAPPGVDLVGFVTGDDEPATTDDEAATTDDAKKATTDDAAAAATDGADRLAGAPLLVTGGTGAMLHPRFYPLALDAVARTGHRAVVVAPDRALLPARLPPHTRWYPRLPFPAVVPRAGALLHHGGIGTAVRALRSGTPQVILAHGADRPDNAARLARFGLARWTDVDRASPELLADLLTTALRRRARPAGEDPARSSETAADLIEATLTQPPPAPVRALSAAQKRLLLRKLLR